MAIFNSSILNTVYLDVALFAFILHSQWFLGVEVYLPSQVLEIFSYYVFRYALFPFPSLFFLWNLCSEY